MRTETYHNIYVIKFSGIGSLKLPSPRSIATTVFTATLAKSANVCWLMPSFFLLSLMAFETIKRDYSGMSGLMMERYFTKKFQEEGRNIVGKWWDRKGDNEIDLIVVDIIEKEAWIYELKKQGYRYKEEAFREKVDIVLEQTPELRKMTIHVGSLSLEDM